MVVNPFGIHLFLYPFARDTTPAATKENGRRQCLGAVQLPEVGLLVCWESSDEAVEVWYHFFVLLNHLITELAYGPDAQSYNILLARSF
jgi:hypothetical protein